MGRGKEAGVKFEDVTSDNLKSLMEKSEDYKWNYAGKVWKETLFVFIHGRHKAGNVKTDAGTAVSKRMEWCAAKKQKTRRRPKHVSWRRIHGMTCDSGTGKARGSP